MTHAFAKATARKLLFATTNPNKLKEVRDAIGEVMSLADVAAVTEPEESGATFWENARLKALAYSQATGLTVVAEDSGLEIEALGGEPGVHSARFLGANTSYAERFVEIYRRLSVRGDKPCLSAEALRAKAEGLSSPARFVTALAVADGTEILFETETTIEGTIAPAPAGTNGFGYDPIFYYPHFAATAAQLDSAQKASVSHRARAFRDLARFLHSLPR